MRCAGATWFLGGLCAVVAQDAFTCQADVSGSNDVFITMGVGASSFQYRIGSGGVISAVNYFDNAGRETSMMSPSYKGELLDRVLQTVWWDDGLKQEDVGANDVRFNENQAGGFVFPDSAGVSAPIFQVRLLDDVDGCGVEVWSVFDQQFQIPLQPYMHSNFSMFTRYVGSRSTGVLSIRKVVRVHDVVLPSGVFSNALNRSYLENWSPFDHPTFDAAAFHVDATGSPDWWYHWNDNIPRYPNTPVEQTHGYVISYDSTSPATRAAVALVFGTKRLLECGSTGDCQESSLGRAVVNSMDFDRGICVLPGIHLPPLTTGALVDYSLALRPAGALDGSLAGIVESAAAALPAPRVHLPGAPLDDELTVVGACLAQFAADSSDGVRTDNLGLARRVESFGCEAASKSNAIV